jgi:hypothetical protein
VERISIAIENAFGFRHLLFKRAIVGGQLIAAVPERRNDSYNVWAQWPGAAQKEIRIAVPTISKKHNHIVSFRCAGKRDEIMARGNNPRSRPSNGSQRAAFGRNIRSEITAGSSRERMFGRITESSLN